MDVRVLIFFFKGFCLEFGFVVFGLGCRVVNVGLMFRN